MNVIGKKVGKYTIEDKYWNDENTIVIYTGLAQLPNEKDEFCLEIVYNKGIISFAVCYESDFVLIDGNIDKYVTSDEKEEFIKIFKEIWENENEDVDVEDEEHFLSEDLYKLMTGEMPQADFIAYWGTDISYQKSSASICVYKDDNEQVISID